MHFFFTLILLAILLPSPAANAADGSDYILHLKRQRDGWLWETPGNAVVWKAFMDQADVEAKAKDVKTQLTLLEAAIEHASCFKEDDPRRIETIAKLKECAARLGLKIEEKSVQQLILPITIKHEPYRMKPAPRTKPFKDEEPMILEGDHLVTDGESEKAIAIYLKTLKNLNARTNRKGHEIVQVVDRLTRIYYKQGRYSDAEIMIRKELKAMESMHDRLDDSDPEKLQLAFLLGDLALVYSGQERLTEAEALYKSGLRIIHRNLGEHHYDYIVTLSELARVHKLMGEYDAAEKEYRQALALSKNHSDCSKQARGVIFGNYAKLLKKMGKNRAASEMEARASELTDTPVPTKTAADHYGH